MPNIGPFELIVILVIALLVIGPGRLPEVGSALGKSIREFRKASSDVTDAARVDTTPAAPAGTPGGQQPAAAPPTTPPPGTSPTAAPAPTPEPMGVTPTATTVPAPVPMPQAPGDDETDPTP